MRRNSRALLPGTRFLFDGKRSVDLDALKLYNPEFAMSYVLCSRDNGSRVWTLSHGSTIVARALEPFAAHHDQQGYSFGRLRPLAAFNTKFNSVHDAAILTDLISSEEAHKTKAPVWVYK